MSDLPVVNDTMKVVALTERRNCTVIDKPRPRIKQDYILIKVHVAPMCNEHHAYRDHDFRDRNRLDSLGHEAAGEIVEVAGFSRFHVGQRVVALSGYPCGTCDLCRSGRYAHCQDTVNPLALCESPSGECCFSQYHIKADWLVQPIPDGMSYEHASMICCGLGATFTAMENMQVAAGDVVLVTGLGAVGLGAIVNAVYRGARVIGAGRQPFRAALARELGAEEVVDPRDAARAHRRILELTGGRGVDVAIECSAAAFYQRLALDAMRRGGRLTFLAESGELTLHIDRDVIQKGLTIFGSLDLHLRDVAPIFRMIARIGPLIDRFITHQFPMTQVRDAWELQLAGHCGKILLRPWA
jgi:L-iditol 2-dehydrogenase